ncbi:MULTISPECIES: polyribonucleotide nucleotidyltransferase [unclassified Frigoribacterium]|uniref:polyribonucleotide nucleotidyltransferase n=1 Tax=unclassified Frigoribacterium TaxID=2627005 RepID=UPI0006F7951C|nr:MULTISPECIES: polyribonucleotide nucleotidyltransferase [unclassified Frigoribacterium]KQM24043.1 polyribonucleotide nucleotidyltransferase [Frigoribacterium sp. Leaf8]MBD8139740.1 polyribonucleotide nucleotidyltransferase [Frigoribacterium sp. CFBP 13605]MBD8484046.1 polyribonucleotide nucleotidyltransferase [Frigoribacterium sp. CFBP 8759]ROS50058.1 polyribonucleotide nucleotidyltransferase [Frigoribacterium sp. PhB118]WAC53058.1 polyribonucleotide nucleotidyltransferase [Frigoribacterium
MEGPEIKFGEAVLDNGKFGKRTIRFETGRLAQQAQGAVAAYLDEDTMLLSATSASKKPKDNFDFFPLTIDVEERSYAAGKIPGSFFRREGRPSTEAILVCRLIDRPLRPSFVEGLRNEVQVVITVLSIAPDEFYDALAINAASASTQISGLPFSGPIAGVRLALIGDQWVAFPKASQLADAVFDLTVAGRVVTDAAGNEDVAIMMVEAEATEHAWGLIQGGATKPDEAIVAQGLEAAKPFLKQLVDAQATMAAQAAKEIADYPVFLPYTDEVLEAVTAAAGTELAEVYKIAGKIERQDADDALKSRVKDAIAAKVDAGELPDTALGQVGAAYKSATKKVVRDRILTEQIRMDGRGLADIRPLDAEVQVIPRVHGSAIFQRGETQIMGVTTLNMLKMEQQIDSLSPVTKKRYLHHYNFPPYSTGETGRVGSPKRREIGHGFLAERALVPVLPSREEFPYAIRQVSEALGSNGSTSMGSVCASTLSLLNAGVPLKAPVAGIAMGLVSDTVDGQTRYAALTDILGAEDALGDMDFKVAGTSEFVTAIQLDTKLDGLPTAVLDAALKQAKEARTAILGVLNSAIDAPDEMAPTAPRVISVQIPQDKIGELIGPKGKTINAIQDETGADISIEEDGTVYIGAVDGPSAEAARAQVNAIANPTNPEIGEQFLGTVVKIASFGAFVSLLPGKDGLLHISEVRKLAGGKRVENVEDVLGVGQKILVEITKIDDRGKLSLAPVVAEEADTDSSGATEQSTDESVDA